MFEGVKDSGSDWVYTENLLKTHDDLLILIGNERHLARGVRLGAQGAISGLANLCPRNLLELIETGEDDPRIDKLANEILEFPFTPAVKALLAHRQGRPRVAKRAPSPRGATGSSSSTSCIRLRRIFSSADSVVHLSSSP